MSYRNGATSDYIDRDTGDRDNYHTRADAHAASRPVDSAKSEQKINEWIKKATTIEETAPKQKHIRTCIMYTWDFKDSESIWTALRVQPVLQDEVQAFKALITVHKILAEGHPIVLVQAQKQVIGWLDTCARGVGSETTPRGYGTLIRAYVHFLNSKLRFHRQHKDFNGVFEYEEYVTLRGTHDPNEGYETISDLMNLQDQIDSFQKLIFAHFRASSNNECRISALVPLVKESYGIYKFITSMMRALHRNADIEALEPLVGRYRAQHFNLRKFYYECSNLKYLVGLISVPKLPQEPPSLTEPPPSVPGVSTPGPRPATTPAPPKTATPGPDIAEQARMLKEFEDQRAEQDRLKAEREAEARRQAELRDRQQREFEDMQRMQAERDRLAQEQLMQSQMQQQAHGRVAELEREIMAMRGQYERDQMMLEQYDRRVKALEGELGMINQNLAASLSSKDDMIKSLQDQVTLWRNKYEALAKLYSQLRTEHLDMLAKFKQMQLKANSAQEAVDKMERMERDVKAKNLELADMIRERDRARFDLDRMKANHKDELERLKRDLRFAEERADDASRNKSSEVQSLLGKYNRQITELEDSLKSKQAELDALYSRVQDSALEISRVTEAKDLEIAALQEGMDHALGQMASAQRTQGESEDVTNAQIDTLILDQQRKFNQVIDSILQASVQKIEDALYELESPMHDGNPTATPEYTQSMVEKAITNTSEFGTVFSLYLGQEPGGEHVEVIKRSNEFAQAIADVLLNTKGIVKFAATDDKSDALIRAGKYPGDTALKFLSGLLSYRIELVDPRHRRDTVIQYTSTVREALTKLASSIEQLVPKQTASLANANGDIGDLVEREMSAAARAIEAATAKLQSLMNRPKDYSSIEISVHDTILEAALAITKAIGIFMKAATASQQEIVAGGRGSGSAQGFYKRNNRWTEGLISAAQAVAWATTTLIETADGVIGGTKTLEQLIVSSNEVAAAVAQVVQASRVKANFMSKTQDSLEKAARAVTEACKALVKQVKAISAKKAQAGADGDFGSMGAHEFKVREMEAQVAIVTLEKDLQEARRRLAEMRRAAYHGDDTAT